MFVGLDRLDQLHVLALFGRALGSTIKLIAPNYEHSVHLVRYAREMRNRFGRTSPDALVTRVWLAPLTTHPPKLG